MTLQEIFIQNLKYYRKQNGMTQNDLTIALNKGYNYINGIEQGRSFPAPDTIEEIAKILHIRAVQLFDENSSLNTAISANRSTFINELADKIYERMQFDMKKSLKTVINDLL